MRNIYFLIFFLISIMVSGQVTDLVRVEYTYFPQRESKNSFKRFRTFINVPIKLNNKGSYLVPGLEYRNVQFDYEDNTPFSVEDLNAYNSFQFTVGYTFKMKNSWRFAAKTGALVASNFEGEGVQKDDILYSGSVYFIKDKTKDPLKNPWRLILGLQYSTVAGRPFPLPFVNYFKRFDPSWTYSLGIPKSNIKYYVTTKNVLQGFITLDGFFANIQNDRMIPGFDGDAPKTAENISMTVALAGVGYEYQFTKHLVFYIYGGYTLLNDIRLRNDSGDDVFTINDTNTVYFRTGLKFKI